MCSIKNLYMAILKLIFILVLLNHFVGGSVSHRKQSDTISFTQPAYHGAVPEKAVEALVDSKSMMGMWLTSLSKGVRFDVVAGSNRFKASERVAGNFVFLELHARFITEPVEVRIRAISADQQQETFCTVFVEVIDINDFQPLFPPVPYTVSIRENTKVGTTITYVKAIDSDRDSANTRLYYSLPAEYTSEYFAVHPTTGAVTLTAQLNAMYQSEHSLKIQATDRKAALEGTSNPKTTTLTVFVQTVNAHSPVISVSEPRSYDSSLTASHNRRNHRVCAMFTIYDQDSGKHGETSFPRITRTDVAGLFEIQPRRGEDKYQLVFTRNPPPMNGILNVTVEVSDRGEPPRTTSKTIKVKLFDKQALIPVFPRSSYEMTVSEFSPVHSQVGFVNAFVLNSPGKQNISYFIESGNDDGNFVINADTALLSTVNRLNRNVRSAYKLTIAAINNKLIDSSLKNTTTVTVIVQDANDHDPLFVEDSYIATLPENVPVGTIVTTIKAQDKDFGINSSIVYSLVEAEDMPFSIDPFNGTIFTKSHLDADVMSVKTFRLRARASDSGLPYSRKSECFIIVKITNINDNVPVFNEVDCTVQVPVSTNPGATLVQLGAIDIDVDLVTCSMVSGSDKMFEVDQATCEVRLSAALTPAKIGQQSSLRIVAVDAEHTSEPVYVNVTITSAGKIDRSCRDTGAIRRQEELMNNLLLNGLHSNAKTTLVNLNRTSQLPNKYTPSVLARKSLTGIKVSEAVPVSTTLARVLAVDRDPGYNGKLWFTIQAGNSDSCFSINSQTGVIKLERSLDRETSSVHNLSIKVTDLGVPPKSSNVKVSFEVTDENDNAPVFDRSLYTFELRENVPVGYIIQSKVRATDLDEGLNSNIKYGFATRVPGDKFSINPVTGFINVTGSLDRELKSKYNLTVIAVDSSLQHPLASTTQVIIQLSDVNDNPPQFYRSVYRIRISEDLPVHSVVFWLQAHDPDLGENGVVRYTLTDGISNKNDAQPRFRVDDRTGAIRLSAKLNSRSQNRYNITARARDSGKLFSTCFVEVEVLPVNRNLHAPYFEHRDIKLKVSENATIGTEISSVTATDEDTTNPENDVRYFITDGTGLGVFSIDQNTGTITTLRKLDRESEQYYWLTVVAEDRASIPLFGQMFVLVEVVDVNDNSPYPSEPIYFPSIPENSSLGSIVTRIHAADRDSGLGSRLTYSMPSNDYFKINSTTGEIRTIKRKLDRESANITQLTFDVTITDAGSPPLSSKARVVVALLDVNDNSPKFLSDIESKIFLLSRNRSRNPEPVARVVAHDEDKGQNSDIDYMLERNNQRKFSINPKTGVISTTKAFRNEQINHIKITAYDLGNPQKHSRVQRVEIQWGPFPQFSTYPPVFTNGGVEEELFYEHVDIQFVQDASQKSSSRIIRLLEATDLDSDHIWFFIADGNSDGMFHLNHGGSLLVVGEPDAERKNFYNLTTVVTDGYNQAYKQVIVNIGDVNDHRPQFEQKLFKARIQENAPPNSRVLSVTATDMDESERNRNLIYSIQGSVDPSSLDMFRITPSGIIYTTAKLDRETQREHILTVQVDDQGVPGSLQDYCRVLITVEDSNEHPPSFTSSHYETQVLTGISDDQIGADDTSDAVILRVQATDSDYGENARITYSISTGNNDNLWKINPSTGEISATRRLIADDGTPTTRSIFTVQATDGGREPLKSTARVIIEIRTFDDSPPRFEVGHVITDVAESMPRKSFVTMMTASAPSGVTYDIISGNSEGRFAINPHSGVVSLAESLDREQQSSYNLIIDAVSTEGKRSSAALTVNVVDVNDNRPYFSPRFYTGFVTESLGSSISMTVTDDENQPLVVKASDPDVGDNSRLTYKIADLANDVTQRFAVDMNTGAVRTRQGTDLFDYESVKEYTFHVQAFDLGSPQLSSQNNAVVTIFVKNVNDSVWEFTKSHYNLQILLPTCEGVVVSRDTVATGNTALHRRQRQITYSISGGNDGSAFMINSTSGLLSVADASVLHDGDKFTLRLRVSDGKRSSATAMATVTVSKMATQHDLNFTRQVYKASVMENSTLVKPLVVATVRGTKLQDNIRFSILNPTPYFIIGSTSGVISTTGIPIDREKKHSYELLVEAVDVHSVVTGDVNSVRRGRAVARIAVEDINDNVPLFVDLPYYATVQIDSLPGTVIKQVQAVDADVGLNRKVRYSLERNYLDMFEIDSRDGVVTLQRTPGDRSEQNTKFNITVSARDMGIPPLTGRSVVQISLVNKATPVFSEPFYGDIFVPEDAKAHSVVTSLVKASSPDVAEVFYTIEAGDPFHQFDIDFIGGTITTLGCLDRETRDKYTLLVRARDAQSRAYADVRVEITVTDVNDNVPVFMMPSYSSSLLETARVGTAVTQVIATDEDLGANGLVQLEIVDDDDTDGGYFLIDANTGVIWTARELDAEEKSVLSFVVRAADAGTPMRSTDVTVTLTVNDVNDNSPVFDKAVYEYQLSAEAKPGHTVGKVSAWDADISDRSKLTYSIQHSKPYSMLEIDSHSGVITLSKHVNLKSVVSPIRCDVSVTDGVFTSSAQLVLYVTTNDTSPVPVTFQQSLYNFSVFENQPSGSKIGKVVASGIGPITYTISSETIQSDMFRVNANTGKIYTAASIDREGISNERNANSTIRFQVTAADSKGFISRCDVSVNVLDENDNAPIYSRDNYAAVVVPNEISIGDFVVKLRADDADEGENGRVIYAWDEDLSMAKRFFNLDVDSGVITVRERPRHVGNVNVYVFYIQARDNGTPDAKTSVAAVSVYLAADSNSIPEFEKDRLNVSLPEDASVGTKVASVVARSRQGEVTYALTEPYVNGDINEDVTLSESDSVDNTSNSIASFSIDPVTGQISIDRSLDREQKDVHVITVVAHAADTTPELVAYAQVTVNVLDANDNSPQFTSSEYFASIVENSSSGTKIIQVEAFDSDKDSFGDVTYSLEPPTNPSFAINPRSGVIVTTKPLDREKTPRYNLTVKASDGGLLRGSVNRRRSSMCHVMVNVIDVNDRPPYFSKSGYSLSILENTPVGRITHNVLRASDNDTGDTTNLTIYVIDGDTNGHFEIVQDSQKSEPNSIRAGLQIMKPLDREMQSFYVLTLLATDGLHNDTSQLRVNVGDINDNSPICEQLTYRGSVSEEAESQTFILRIISSDADSDDYGRISYTLTGENNSMFNLDPRTGELFTSEPFDREKTPEFWLSATSTDGEGRSCVSKVHIIVDDVNDNPPQFEASTLRTTTRENTPVESLLHRVVAYDLDLGDNGTFTFSLLNDFNGQFHIEPDTGVVILKKPLDRETVPSYQLPLLVSDHGSIKQLTATAELAIRVLDVNDNPPIFDRTKYEVTLKEDTVPGFVVEKVSAVSLDTGTNAKLKYSITNGNQHGKFAMNSDTGEVSLVSKVDYETDQSFVLTICASDRSENPLSTECTLLVNIVDVNDNSPQFSSPLYKVSAPEDAETGRFLIDVSATDRDSGEAGNVTYSLSSTKNIPFSIDPISGRLTLSPPGLDYETQKTFRLNVIASDGGSPIRHSEAVVFVTVTDVNDNRPKFIVTSPLDGEKEKVQYSSGGANCTVYVHESASESVVNGVAQLNGSDADGEGNAAPFTFKIIEGNDAGLFYLDSNNVVKSFRLLTLDDSKSSSSQRLVHQLSIVAKDSGSPISLSSQPLHLNIIVLKESQYAPVLSPHRVQITIAEDEISDNVIAQGLHATDRDAFDQDRIRFSLALPEDFERFVVDPLSGAITAMSPLYVGSHNISVRVSDGSLSSISVVPVTVTEVNKQALENSVSISFRGISSIEEYLSLYHSLFVDRLRNLLPVGFNEDRDLLVISLQSNDSLVNVLFAVRKPPSTKAVRDFYLSKSLRGILEKSRILIEEKLRIEVASIEGTACSADDCEHGVCRQVPELLSTSVSHPIVPVSTVSYSLVTLHFQRIEKCVCPSGTAGKLCQPICSDSNNPCPSSNVCKADDSEEAGYRCDLPQQAKTVMSFSGRSFVQYSLEDEARKSPFQVHFRMRTYQSNATIFHASGPRHYARLETNTGLLRYTFDCGSGPQTMVRDLMHVNNGRWCNVSIDPINDDSSSCAFKLTLDVESGKYVATAKAPGGEAKLDLDSITFGGMPSSGRSKRSLTDDDDDDRRRRASLRQLIQKGFIGCVEEPHVNNAPLSHTTSPPGIRKKGQHGVSVECLTKAIVMKACAHSPCLNGGTCMPLPDGSHECYCPLAFTGDSCETPDPCGPVPCKNKGYCLSIGENIRCKCNGGFVGDRCEIPSACLTYDSCLNGGECVLDNKYKPMCRCEIGWSGQNCGIDVNECENSPLAVKKCGGKTNCFNYEGGYACNCSTGGIQDVDQYPSDPNCKFTLPIFKDDTEFPIAIVIVVVLVVLIIIVILFVACIVFKRRTKHNNKKYGGSQRSKDITPAGDYIARNFRHRNTIPPQVPRRPTDYQRSSRDSYHNDPLSFEDQEQRNPLVGLVHPHPQLPPVSPSMSGVSDNDSMRKPPPSWQDYDPSKFNESAASSMHRFPQSRKTSCPSISEEQSYDWDVTDWKPSGSGVVAPVVASVAYNRPGRSRGASDVPSSPESRRSINSTSTCRSRRSYRTDALPGYYASNGRRRREKQLLQMVALKAKNEQDNIEIQQMLSHLVQQGVMDNPYHSKDSRNNSLRSFSSRHQPSFQRNANMPALPSEAASPSASHSADSYTNSFADNECDDEEQIETMKRLSPPACISSSNSPASSSDRPSDSDCFTPPGTELPPPPTDHELQVLRDDDDDDNLLSTPVLLPATSNESYSSLLASPYSLELPTPAVARSTRFHPDQYLIKHRQDTSELSLLSDSVQGSQYSLNFPYVDNLHHSNNLPFNATQGLPDNTPPPPARHDSERLAMSSLSEEDDELPKSPPRQKRRHVVNGRPPVHPKSRPGRRSKKHSARSANWRNNEVHQNQDIKLLHMPAVDEHRRGDIYQLPSENDPYHVNSAV